MFQQYFRVFNSTNSSQPDDIFYQRNVLQLLLRNSCCSHFCRINGFVNSHEDDSFLIIFLNFIHRLRFQNSIKLPRNRFVHVFHFCHISVEIPAIIGDNPTNLIRIHIFIQKKQKCIQPSLPSSNDHRLLPRFCDICKPINRTSYFRSESKRETILPSSTYSHWG